MTENVAHFAAEHGLVFALKKSLLAGGAQAKVARGAPRPLDNAHPTRIAAITSQDEIG